MNIVARGALLQLIQKVAQESAEIDRFQLERFRPRKLKELGHDASERVALFEKRVDELFRFVSALPFQKLGIAHDRPEAVSELVGNPGDHFTQPSEVLLE